MPDPIISTTDAPNPSAPAGAFSNASLFRRHKEENDPVLKGILIGLAIVVFVFFCSMIAVLFMHAPPL